MRSKLGFNLTVINSNFSLALRNGLVYYQHNHSRKANMKTVQTVQTKSFGRVNVQTIGNLEFVMETAKPSHHSVSGCMTGNYSWGTSYYGSLDGVRWTPLGVPSTHHTQNNSPTGWEKRGTTETDGQVGIVGWRRFKFILQTTTGPERHSGDTYLGRHRSAVCWKVPCSLRNISVSRAIKRSN